MTSVSIAWNVSTDNSGNFSYRVRFWGDPTVVTLPKTQTFYTWTGLRPGVQYYFWVEAVDGSGNKSTSDLLVVETVRDVTAPSTPGNRNVGSVTASQVSLSWGASTDDSGIIDLYQVNVSPLAGERRLHRRHLSDGHGPGALDRIHVHGEGARRRLELLRVLERRHGDDRGEHRHNAAHRAHRPEDRAFTQLRDHRQVDAVDGQSGPTVRDPLQAHRQRHPGTRTSPS